MKRLFFHTGEWENAYRYSRDKRIIARITLLRLSSSWLDPCLDFYPRIGRKSDIGGRGELWWVKTVRGLSRKSSALPTALIPGFEARYVFFPRPSSTSSRTTHRVLRGKRAHGFNNYRYRYRNERNWLLRQFQFAEQSEIK